MDRKLAIIDGRVVYVRESKDRNRMPEILPDEIPEICRGVKYASRTEALRHIEQGIEPGSLALVRLRERVQAAEERAAAAETKAAMAETRAAARVDELEARLRTLEDAEEKAAVEEEGEEEKEKEAEEAEGEKGKEEPGKEAEEEEKQKAT